MKCVLMVGPPGSGKSTVAKRDYADHVYVNQDSQGLGHVDVFEQAISEGRPVVVDRMGFSKEQRSRYLSTAKDAGYHTEIVVIHESYDTCYDRMLKREGHETVKDEKSRRGALRTFFTKYERVSDDEADVATRVWPEGNKPEAIWVDIDNTLSDAAHREHFLKGEKKNWKGFFDNMDRDPVNEWCKALANGMYSSVVVLICSARPSDYRSNTQAWLSLNGVKYHELIMRLGGDFRKDSIVKEIMYEFEIKSRYNLLFSVDDRRQVIDQMRTHSIVVLDCAGEKGNF